MIQGSARGQLSWVMVRYPICRISPPEIQELLLNRSNTSFRATVVVKTLLNPADVEIQDSIRWA